VLADLDPLPFDLIPKDKYIYTEQLTDYNNIFNEIMSKPYGTEESRLNGELLEHCLVQIYNEHFSFCDKKYEDLLFNNDILEIKTLFMYPNLRIKKSYFEKIINRFKHIKKYSDYKYIFIFGRNGRIIDFENFNPFYSDKNLKYTLRYMPFMFLSRDLQIIWKNNIINIKE